MNEITFNEVNTEAKFLPSEKIKPFIHPAATIRNSQITGNVTVEEKAHIVNAVIRADEGTPFYIGVGSNIQDFAVLHGYTTQENNNPVEQNLIFVDGVGYYSIYISENVSISHGVLVHGPSYIKENTFIGFKSTIDAANIGSNVEIGAHSYIKGVNIPDNIAICANAVIVKPEDIEKFIIPARNINKRIVEVNKEMAVSYNDFF
jgi:carbonic anhydrase/acetyltransferase-like protein (isoleucine patch superfamily)